MVLFERSVEYHVLIAFSSNQKVMLPRFTNDRLYSLQLRRRYLSFFWERFFCLRAIATCILMIWKKNLQMAQVKCKLIYLRNSFIESNMMTSASTEKANGYFDYERWDVYQAALDFIIVINLSCGFIL